MKYLFLAILLSSCVNGPKYKPNTCFSLSSSTVVEIIDVDSEVYTFITYLGFIPFYSTIEIRAFEDLIAQNQYPEVKCNIRKVKVPTKILEEIK